MTDLLKDLDAVALLAEKATPGEWHRHTDCPGLCCWHMFTSPDGIYSKGDDGLINSPEMSAADAAYIAALSNLFRTHHAEIAEAVKDARRYRMTRHKLTCGKLTVDEELSIIGAKDGQAFDATIDAMHNSAREAGE